MLWQPRLIGKKECAPSGRSGNSHPTGMAKAVATRYRQVCGTHHYFIKDMLALQVDRRIKVCYGSQIRNHPSSICGEVFYVRLLTGIKRRAGDMRLSLFSLPGDLSKAFAEEMRFRSEEEYVHSGTGRCGYMTPRSFVFDLLGEPIVKGVRSSQNGMPKERRTYERNK